MHILITDSVAVDNPPTAAIYDWCTKGCPEPKYFTDFDKNDPYLTQFNQHISIMKGQSTSLSFFILRLYTINLYIELNQYLRRCDKRGQVNTFYEWLIELLDSIFVSMHSIQNTEPIVVWRGESNSTFPLVGTHKKFSSYTSTSTSKKIARFFADDNHANDHPGIVYKINLTDPTKAIPTMILQSDEMSAEYEVLLARDLTFEVTEVNGREVTLTLL